MNVTTPETIRLRTYNVGFGDCFLLTFAYPDATPDHHMLIDCGTTRLPRGGPKSIAEVTADIAAVTNNKLHVVVATHRHRDHISGFGGTAGEHIAACNPDLVLQPWTEDPELEPDATAPPPTINGGSGTPALRFTHQLASMELAAETLAAQARNTPHVTKTANKQLAALGDINVSNRAAVMALRNLGHNRRYLSHGQPSGIEDVIPGVNATVLGPPTLDQWSAIRRQRATDTDEFWSRSDDSEFWHLIADATGTTTSRSHEPDEPLFPDAKTQPEKDWSPPIHWLVPKLHELRGNQLLSLVRILDRALNNTSLILMLQVGDRRLLFSGDAQIEAWEYPLAHAPDAGQLRNLLRWTNVYKVGHHGSLNATPKSLWKLFKRRDAPEHQRLLTVLSTMNGVHGHGDHGTEVPRRTLVAALEAETTLLATRALRGEHRRFHDLMLTTSRHRPLIVGDPELPTT